MEKPAHDDERLSSSLSLFCSDLSAQVRVRPAERKLGHHCSALRRKVSLKWRENETGEKCLPVGGTTRNSELLSALLMRADVSKDGAFEILSVAPSVGMLLLGWASPSDSLE